MQHTRESLVHQFTTVRALTRTICEPLDTEDYAIRPAEFVRSPKWHLGHTSWFFEKFVLQPYFGKYEAVDPIFEYLFNSDDDPLGRGALRGVRSSFSRPTVREVNLYRDYIDKAVPITIMGATDDVFADIVEAVTVGLAHEQRHQEVLLMDIKYIFGTNVLKPRYSTLKSTPRVEAQFGNPLVLVPGGSARIGYDGDGFCFANERPAHDVIIKDFHLARSLATNAEFLGFVEQGGYTRRELWSAEGWAALQREQWHSPLYWELLGGVWYEYTLTGLRPLDFESPVCHVSFYEAEAFAKFNEARLPSEFEWEYAAQQFPHNAAQANFLEADRFHPTHDSNKSPGIHQLVGDLWEWTTSELAAYPGNIAPTGPLAEFHGTYSPELKVLRGGCCVTPRESFRVSYRAYMIPQLRWNFAGIRLAKDA